MEPIEEYGADATRYGLLKISSTQDVRFSYGAIEEGRKLAIKLWNVARLILQNAEGVARVGRAARSRGALDPRATRRRPRRARGARGRASTSPSPPRRSTTSPSTTSATGTRRRSSRGSTTATRRRSRRRSAALERLLALLHPVMPHVTEEIWSQLPGERGAPDRLAVARARRRLRRRCRRARPRAGGGADLPAQRRAGRARLGRRAPHLRGRRPPRARAGRRQPRRRDRAAAQGGRARRGHARERALRRRTRRPTSWPPSARSSSATAASSPRSKARHMTAVEWLDAMSPWPRDGFGLDRMRALLAELGDPQDAYPAIHVVGTNGKSTATVTIEQLLLSEGLSVGSTISPHVAGWSERIRLDGRRRTSRPRSRVSARPRSGSTRRSSRSSPPPRSRRSRTRASTSPSSRRGSAAATTRRTSFARASCS